VKKTITIGLAATALAATLTLVGASSIKRGPAITAEPADAAAHRTELAVLAMGLGPLGAPVRRGAFYLVHAVDPRGVEMRVVADAEFGDIIAVTPLHALRAVAAQAPATGGPRIIQVPQPNDQYAAASRRQTASVDRADDDVEELPPRRAEPRFPPRSEKPAPVTPPRKVLSAVKPIHDGPTPIRPLPRYDPKAEQGEKFGPPGTISPGTPAPAVLPQADITPAAEPAPSAQ